MSRFIPSSSTNAERLIADLNSARVTRRGFVSGAAGLGIAAPLAGAIFAAGSQNAGAVSLQDGGKTLVVAIPQSTVQLDPAIAGSNGYGDIIPIHDNMTEGLTRFKPGTVEIEAGAGRELDGIRRWPVVRLHDPRPGVTFHDGTPLDAAAVETNFLRQLDRRAPAAHREHGLRRDRLRRRRVGRGDRRHGTDRSRLGRPTTLLPGNLAIFARGDRQPDRAGVS